MVRVFETARDYRETASVVVGSCQSPLHPEIARGQRPRQAIRMKLSIDRRYNFNRFKLLRQTRA
jgi:hypothetical protein